MQKKSSVTRERERERGGMGRQYRRHNRFSDSYYSSCRTSFCNSELKFDFHHILGYVAPSVWRETCRIIKFCIETSTWLSLPFSKETWKQLSKSSRKTNSIWNTWLFEVKIYVLEYGLFQYRQYIWRLLA
jgi:hypothetical protein